MKRPEGICAQANKQTKTRYTNQINEHNKKIEAQSSKARSKSLISIPPTLVVVVAKITNKNKKHTRIKAMGGGPTPRKR